MEHSRYICDICKSEKGEGNHWLLVLFSPLRFNAIPWDIAAQSDLLRHGQHICGQECAHKLLSQWLENITRPAPANSQEAV